MFDTGFYNQGRGLESGLRSGAAIGGMIKGGMDTSAVQNAAQRIQAGENQQAVISELMAKSPQAAQQLMNLLGGQQNLDAGATEIEALKTKVGMQSLQQAALPIFGALQVDDDGARSKLLNEAAMVFEKQSPETAAVIKQIGTLQGKQQFDAVAGIVKSLRSAGVFPDDPSQMTQSMPADVSKFEYWKQMNPNATEAEAREVYNKIIDPFYRSQASAQGAAGVKLETEQSMNDVLAQREAAKVGAVEKTGTGAAKLAQAEQAVEVGKNAAQEEQIRKSKQLDLSQQTVKLAREIANSPLLGAVTGVMAEAPTINPQSKDLIIKAQQLVAMMTAENLKLMSGVLTQTDMELLQTLSTGLKVDDKGIKGSEQAVAKQLNNIANKIEATLSAKGAATGAQPAQRDEASILKEYGL